MMLSREVEHRGNIAFQRIGKADEIDIKRAFSCAIGENQDVEFEREQDYRTFVATLLMGQVSEFIDAFQTPDEREHAALDIISIWNSNIVRSPEFSGRERDSFDIIYFISVTGDFAYMWDLGMSAGIPSDLDSFFSGIPICDIIA